MRVFIAPCDTLTLSFISQEYILVVDLCRFGRKTSNHIYSPKFPKPKDEGWFLTLGSIENRELLAMKRVAYRNNKSSHQLFFTAPKKQGNIFAFLITNSWKLFAGRVIYTVYLMSDGYIGFDQQFNINFDVTKSPKAVETDDYERTKEKYYKLFEWGSTLKSEFSILKRLLNG